MSYDEFVGEIREKLNSITGGDVKISVCTAIKNNNCERKGIVFSETGNNVSPTIYLEEYYERFLEGQEMEKIAFEIVRLYEQVKFDHSFEGDFVRDYENIKDKIVFRLINMEKNEKYLQQIPYVKYLDLAIVFSVLLEIDQKCGQVAMMQIKNEHLELWNVNMEDVYRSALLNTQRLLPFEFQTMFAVITDMMGKIEGSDWYEQENDGDIYVLTNKYRNCGAVSMCYPEILDLVGDKLNQNYYILPSSIHEVIIVPEKEALSVAEMKKIVKEVNDTYVHMEEYLSDNIYYYDREQKSLILSLA